MKLRAEQVQNHLAQGLRPIYVLGGDEPLQIQELGDQIRAAARAQGYDERQVLSVEPGFAWDSLLQATANLSLFGGRRLVELRMPGSKPGDVGAKALRAYAEQPAEDTVLLVVCGRLDSAVTRSSWLKALEGAGVLIQVWPVEAGQLPAWVQRRMQALGLQAGREAAALLAQRVEGNLLAAAQEIDKLVLLYGSGRVDAEQVAAAVTDSSRFNVYTLVDSALAGQKPRLLRILLGLQAEGVEPVLAAWALTREVRSLSSMAHALAAGQGVEAVLARNRVWERRKPLVRAALKRHPLARWQSLLRQCAQVDQVVKGAALGKPWAELVQLSLRLAS